jgi:hypothetical protein
MGFWFDVNLQKLSVISDSENFLSIQEQFICREPYEFSLFTQAGSLTDVSQTMKRGEKPNKLPKC